MKIMQLKQLCLQQNVTILVSVALLIGFTIFYCFFSKTQVISQFIKLLLTINFYRKMTDFLDISKRKISFWSHLYIHFNYHPIKKS